MIFHCSHCGAENPAGKNFCGDCGASLSDRCPQCDAESSAEKNFCAECGATLRVSAVGSRVPELARTRRFDASRSPTQHPPPEQEGERRQLTVLFCDLVGSTPLSQQFDAEEWRDIIGQYQEAASGAVARWGGHVAKNLGDGLLIYFGWPSAREDDPERAVRAGLAIVEGVKGLGVTGLGDPALPLTPNPLTRNPLSVRVGMHTGPVVIADGGEVFGETANVAARVQSAAQADTVVITAATQRLVAGMFAVEDNGPQLLKGVREPVTLYRVIQPSGVRSRLAVAAGRLTRFVGRDMELGTLIDRWERAAEGEGQNVMLLGEAGVGKSRLVYQLRERLAAVPHTWLECRSTSYTEGTPFFPVIELVQQGLAFAPEDTAVGKLARIERGLSAAGLKLAEVVPLMADFLGVPYAETYAPLQMSPELQRRKTMELLATWNLALAEVQPLVLLIEDLHWSDPSSLELLGRIIAQSPTARVLVLGTARPEFTPPWPARSNMTTLQLARLTKRQTREMVAMLGGSGLQAEMVEVLVTRADGVPLYVEELTKAVVEPGTTRTVEAIPATLADSLMARLDRLSTAKEVAQRAAVLGREFSHSLIAAVAGLEDAVLRRELARLIEAEIVFARGQPPAATYTFKHALVQEAAYESLLKRTRQQLHGRVVEVLVKEFPERVAAEPEMVARHAQLAGRIDEAIAHYQRAGDQAQARSAHEEAIRHLRTAIALLGTKQAEGAERDAYEVALQLGLGGSLVIARGYSDPECEAAYERARALCDALGDVRRRGLALVGLSSFYSNRGDVERGRELGLRLLTAAEQSGDRELTLLGHVQVAVPEHWQGKFASSGAHSEVVRNLYEAGRHHGVVSVVAGDPGVTTLSFEAWNLWQLGWPDRALARAREAVVLARQVSHAFNVASAVFFEATVHWLRGDVTTLRERVAETIALSEAQGFPLYLGLGRAFQAAARVASGDPGAIADMLAGLALGAGSGNLGGAPALFTLLGQTHMAAAQIPEARNAVETGLALATQTGQRFFDAELHRLAGEIVLATGGTPADIEAVFQRALEIARAQEAKSFELRAATSLARLWRSQRKPAEARDLLAPTYAWFTEGFETRDLVDAKALLAEL